MGGRWLFSSSGTLPTDDTTNTIQSAGGIRSNTGFNVNGVAGYSGTVANPTSITVSGGIITAIS